MYYVDTIAGGGKTRSAITDAAKQATLGTRTIIALPSKMAIDQCLQDMEERFPMVECAGFHGDTHKKPVAAIIKQIKAMWNCKGEGFVMFISHAAMMYIPEALRDGWHLIVDETLPVAGCHTHNAIPMGLRRTLRIESMGAAYSRVYIAPSCQGVWKRIAAGKHDARETKIGLKLEFWRYKALANALLNPHVDVLGLTEQWTKPKLENSATQVSFFTMLNPSCLTGFSGYPTIMSACLKDTLMYHIWTVRNGIEWKSHKRMTKMIADSGRGIRHQNGHLLNIYYATERDYSKKLRDTQISIEGIESSEQTICNQDLFIDAVRQLFGSKRFVFMCNNDASDMVEVMGKSGIRLPNTPHGLNSYQEIHNCAIFSALNLTPAQIKFLSQWVSADEIRQAITYQATYQAALRISLRNPNDRTDKVLVVQDKGAADYIAKLFSGSQVALLQSAITDNKPKAKGRGRFVNDALRKRAYREEQRLLKEVGMYLIGDESSKKSTISICAENVPHTIYTIPCGTKTAHDFTPLGMSVFEDKYSATSFYQMEWTGIADFVSAMRELHADVYVNKEDNKLISPSLFDPQLAAAAGDFNEKGEAKSRSRTAVASSIGIWLDNDNGLVSHQDFAALFPDLEMVIYNTYSSTQEKPKYRVWIPTTHGMSADVYMFLANQIRAKVESLGHKSARDQMKWINTELKKYDMTALGAEELELVNDYIASQCPITDHGFDWSKTYPENLMYLPCQAAAGSAASFFLHHQDAPRKPLDVKAWISYPIVDTLPQPVPEPIVVAPEPVLPPTGTMSPARAKIFAALQAQEAQTNLQIQQHRVMKAINDYRQLPTGCDLRNNGFFVLACALRRAGYDLQQVRTVLVSEAGNDNKRKAQVRSIIDTLRKKRI